MVIEIEIVYFCHHTLMANANAIVIVIVMMIAMMIVIVIPFATRDEF
jgi:hypothetical protein